MADYIERENAYSAIRRDMFDKMQRFPKEKQRLFYLLLDLTTDIGIIPAADVRENVRGSWIWDNDGYDWGIGAYICSNCKSRPGTWWAGDRNKNPLLCSGGSFCGNCGADMRGLK